MKAQSPQESVDGPFLVQVMVSEWQWGQMMWTGSSEKLSESNDGDDEGDGMIGSFNDPISEKKVLKNYLG